MVPRKSFDLLPVRCHGLEGPASPEGPVVSFIYLFIFIYCFLNFLTFVNKIFVGHTVLNISIPIRRSLYMGLLVPFRPL